MFGNTGIQSSWANLQQNLQQPQQPPQSAKSSSIPLDLIGSCGSGGDDLSPSISSTSSIVSIDSIIRHKRTTTSAVQGAFASDFTSKSTGSRSSEPSGNETSTLANTDSRADSADDSFTRHHKYFFKDGNITFLVDGTLYCVHRYFFSRDSVYFSTRFDQLSIRDHEALPITISLGSVERKDFEAFLSILYPENFEERDLSYEEWKSVLDLATCWDFASIRRLALNNIQPPTPHDRLILARTYSVDHWVIPALSTLCEREAPLSLEEARQMDIEDVVLVATVREDIRSRDLQVDATEIPCRVEAAQAGKPVRIPVHIDSVDVSPAVPTSGAAERASSPVDQEPTSKDRDTDETVGEVLEIKQEAPIGVRTEEPAQPIEDSQAEGTAMCTPEVEIIRRRVKEAMRKTEEMVIMGQNAEEAMRKAQEAKLEQQKVKIEEARCKAEASERLAEAARVVILEAVTESEKAAANAVSQEASKAAKKARAALVTAVQQLEAMAKSKKSKKLKAGNQALRTLATPA